MAIYDTRAPGADRPLDHVQFGPGLGPDLDHRLLGEVEGRNVLVLGCGAGHDAVGLAARRALVTAVDPDEAQVSATRQLAMREEVVLGVRQAEPADLAFLQGDRFDLTVSVQALGFVEDLDRVLRQVHRVLKPGGHLVIAVTHPALLTADPSDPDRTIRRWDSAEPIDGRWVHRAEDLVTALHRANFEIDTVLERAAPGPASVPATLLARGGKLGA